MADSTDTNNNNDGESGPTSFSSLKSRFEQLSAGSESSKDSKNDERVAAKINGSAVPPKPAKPLAFKRATSQPSSSASIVLSDASPTAAKSNTNGSTQAPEPVQRAGSTSSLSLPAPLLPSSKGNDIASGPPPIPLASRPAPLVAPTASKLPVLPVLPTSPARKRSKSPPPVPTPRHISRSPSPTVPLGKPMAAYDSDNTKEAQDDSLLGVAGLASKFGGQSPSRTASPASPSFSRPISRQGRLDTLRAPDGTLPDSSPDAKPGLRPALPPLNGLQPALLIQSPSPTASNASSSILKPIPISPTPRRSTFAATPEIASSPSSLPTPIPPLPPRSAPPASSGVPMLPARRASDNTSDSLLARPPPPVPSSPSSSPVSSPPSSTLGVRVPRSPVQPVYRRPRASTVASPTARNVTDSQSTSSPPQAPPRRHGTVALDLLEAEDGKMYKPPPPPTRTIPPGEKATLRAAAADTSGTSGTSTPNLLDSESDDEVDEEADAGPGKRTSEMPDATFANHRPPQISPERKIRLRGLAYDCAICGRYAVTTSSHVRIWDTYTGENTSVISLPGESKITAVAFVYPEGSVASRGGSVVWAGTKEGNLYEIDVLNATILESRTNAHSHPITNILRMSDNQVTTICEAGKVQTWQNTENPKESPRLSHTPRTQRLSDKQCFAAAAGRYLWTSSGPHRQHNHPSLHSSATMTASRSPAVKVHDITSDAAFTVTARALYTPECAGLVGAVTAFATFPSKPGQVFLGHDTGQVSIWDITTLTCLSVAKILPMGITAMTSVLDYLWVSNREGIVFVYDLSTTPWTVLKAWKALDEPIMGFQVDLNSIHTLDKVHVAAYGRESIVFWDGLLKIDWQEQYMLNREAEFSTYRDIKVHILSWNIDSCKPTDLQGDAVNIDFLQNAISSSMSTAVIDAEPPEILVFGFQEVVDLEDKKLTAKSMLLGKKKVDHMFQDQVSHQYMRWHDRLVQAVRTAMPASVPYSVVHAESLVGLFTCIFVRNSEKPNLSDLARVTVKTGMGGRYGNKGAICARLVIDDSSICFMNCHLAAGQRAKRQRNKDLIDILENKSAFLQPSSAFPGVYIGGIGQTVFEHEVCFLSGDLNYRIDLTRSIVKSNIRSNNLRLLLEHDQLLKELNTNQTFRLRSFREAEITFPPTYKFDPGTNEYDSSEKERIPAWCDRIMYRSSPGGPSTSEAPKKASESISKVRPLEYRSWPANPSDHKPITGLFQVRVKKMNSDYRGQIWQQAEAGWSEKEEELMEKAKRYYW